MARVDTPISYINLAAPLEIRPTRGKSRVERDGKRNSTALLLTSSFPVNSIRPNIFPLLRNGRGSRSQGSRATMSPSSESFFYFSLPLWKVSWFLLPFSLSECSSWIDRILRCGGGTDRIFELEWNFVRGRVVLDSLDFPGIWWKAEGVVCSWRAINQSDSDNWWNNGAIDNDTREKIVFVGWNWVPTSFRDSI